MWYEKLPLFLLHKQSLDLRTGMNVVQNRNISVSSVWTWYERDVCVFGLGVVQKRSVFVLNRCERNVSSSLVWRGTEEECLCVFGLDIVREGDVFDFGLDVVREVCLHVFGMDIV
jgi:hypothetical protein